MKHLCVRNKYAGRAYQSKIAKRLGGKSVGTIEGQDVSHPVFSMECKKMKGFPSWLYGLKKKRKNKKVIKIIEVGHWAQALHNCPAGKIPLLLMHRTKDNHEDDFVVMRLGDFERLVKPKKLTKIERITKRIKR
jgi:hypothetical protein